MAQATADTLMAPAGATRGRFGRGTPAGPQIALGFDAATPGEINIRAPITGTVPEGTQVRAQWRVAGGTVWRDDRLLSRIRLSDIGTLPAELVGKVTNSFVGAIVGLPVSTSATTYDVRLVVNTPGLATAYITGQATTRALPAAAPAVTHTATPATLNAILAALPAVATAPTHIRLSAGTYPFSARVWNKGGSPQFPLYVSAATLGDVIISTPSGVCMYADCDDVVFEKIRFAGSGVYGGTSAPSHWLWPTPTRVNKRWSFVYCEVNGFDRAAKAWEPLEDFTFIECLVDGNATWNQTYENDPATGYPGLTWNADAFSLPGTGHWIYRTTIRGHGDTYKGHSGDGIRFTAANWVRECRVLRGGDDAFEADETSGNVGAYDSMFSNVGNGLSVDGTFGPAYFLRNGVINHTRGPVKPTSKSLFAIVENNTFISGETSSTNGIYAATADTQRGLRFVNNLSVHRGAGSALHWSAALAEDTWGPNGWFPDRGFVIASQNYATLAAAKAAMPARFSADVVVTTNPFAATIAQADFATEYTGTVDLTLAAGSTARGAGVALPGTTDGFSGGTPALGCVIPGRPVPQYGRSVDSGAEAWLSARPVGTWGIVPAANTAAAIDPANDSTANPNGAGNPPPWNTSAGGTLFASGSFSRTMSAWCGGCLDAIGGNFHVNAAGGHTDYFGNCSFRLELNRAVPQWVRYSNPSVLPTYSGGENTGRYSDGRARSAHTYNAPVYVPGLGPIVANQQAMATSGAPGAGEVVSFNETTGAETYWAASTSGSGSGSSACWDADLGVVWHRPNGSQPMRNWKRDRAPQHVTVGGVIALDGGVSMCHLQGLGCILIGNGDDTTAGPNVPSQTLLGGWAVFDTATGTLHSPQFIGAPTTIKQTTLGVWPGTAQPRWDAARRCAYVWDNRSNTTQIMRLTPGANPRTDPWVIDTLPVSGANTVTPTAAQNSGTFGRMWLWRDCIFVVNAVDQPTYFFRVA